MTPASPLVHWPGGKARLLDVLDAHVPPGPVIEPFVGAGSILFHRGGPTVVADACRPLRWVYATVRDDPERVHAWMEHQPKTVAPKDPRYYELRSALNDLLATPPAELPDWGPFLGAALFLWLNKAGYNGLVRFSHAGKYNVPCGSGGPVNTPSLDALLAASKVLQDVTIHDDWRRALAAAGPGDRVVLDPPYQPAVEGGGFVAYTPAGWTLTDLEALALAAAYATERGATVWAFDHVTPTTQAVWEDVGATLVWSDVVGRPVARTVEARRRGATEGLWRLDPDGVAR